MARKASLRIKVARTDGADGWVGFVCTVDGQDYYAPNDGGLFMDDWRPLLPASDYVALDAREARWLVRRALED